MKNEDFFFLRALFLKLRVSSLKALFELDVYKVKLALVGGHSYH